MPLTVSQIGELIGENYERTKYGIRLAGVKPIGKAGSVNLFRRGDVKRIQAALSRAGRVVRPA